jgi:hypothetical protein
VYDYEKLSDILRREAGLFEKVISSTEDGLRLDPEYFRVGFYGKSFALFLRVRNTVCVKSFVANHFLLHVFILRGSVRPFHAYLLQVAAVRVLGNIAIISPRYH